MFSNINEFYPSPNYIIEKMLSGIKWEQIESVLEPSAGKGCIVDFIKNKLDELNKYLYRKNIGLDIDCIEINEDLRHILKGKGYKVVHDDFLQYNTFKQYDLIVMNPPFSNGDIHLLKALKMQESCGGGIICILNAETLKNAYTNVRKDLINKLNEYNAEIEYLNDAFINAERKTNVEIAIVKVVVPEIEHTSFILDELKKAKEVREFEESESTNLIENDFYKAIVNQYRLEIEAGIKLIKEYKAMAPLLLSRFSDDGKIEGEPILKLDLSSNRDKYTLKLTINKYIQEVRAKYWTALFHNEKFIGNLTNNLRYDFYNQVGDLQGYDFTIYNICQLKIDMNNKVLKGIENTIIKMFDELSRKYHWYNETSYNIHYYNGWKTNKSWIINKKVIIPLSGFIDLEYSWGGYKPSNSKVIDTLKDMEKCFNYLDCGITKALDMEKQLKYAEENLITKKVELKYFTISFYKKGTCHIEFTNFDLLKKFNIFGSQQKGWLPPSYGKTEYKNMSDEEKIVIDEFEGQEEYTKVMQNKDFYIYKGNNLLMLDTQQIA